MPTTTSAPSSATPVAATVQPKLRTSCVPDRSCRRFIPSWNQNQDRGGREEQRAGQRDDGARERIVMGQQPREVEHDRRAVRDRGDSPAVPAEKLQQQHEDRRNRQRRQPDEHAIVPAILRNRRRATEAEAVGTKLISDLLDHFDVGRLDGELSVWMQTTGVSMPPGCCVRERLKRIARRPRRV